MWWFGNQRVEQRITELDANTALSFQRAKTDIQAIQQWISYLHRQQQELARKAAESTERILSIPSAESWLATVRSTSQTSAHAAIQTALAPALAQLQDTSNRLHVVENELTKTTRQMAATEDRLKSLQPLPRQIHELRDLVSTLHNRREERDSTAPAPVAPAASVLTRFREKVLRKLTTHSKDYIKGLLLTTIHKYGRINGQQLREIIVDEQGLCSRSSFYRLLDELENDATLTVVPDGKNKIYLTKTQQRSH